MRQQNSRNLGLIFFADTWYGPLAGLKVCPTVSCKFLLVAACLSLSQCPLFSPRLSQLGVCSASDQGCSNSNNLWLVLTHSLSPHRDNGRSTSLVASVFISISTFNDDQEVVLVEREREGRRSLVSFGRRVRWRILQQSGNKETKRFLHAIFMKIASTVIVQRSEMSQCSVSVILTSSGLRTLGA